MIRPEIHATRVLLSICSLLLSVYCLIPTAFAQNASATLSGTVEDQNGGVVAGASVTIINVGTRLQREAVTNDQGGFTVPLLPPSTYTIRVRRDGFAPIEVQNVVLNVGDNKAIQIQLKAGDVNAQVTVDSDAEAVRTDGSVGTVVNQQFVSSILLNGRTLQPLLQLTPGVVLTTINNGGTTT